MTLVDENEILEIEKLKADLRKVIQDSTLDMKRFDLEMQKFDLDKEKRMTEIQKFDLEIKKLSLDEKKNFYEALRLAFYGVAVGAGGTFAIAKTLQILQAT